ncbi:TPA: MBOAT family O-acyltransferase [Legionella pneumophila]|nr:hypothetical protein [Legionella pneumophila]
MIFPWSSLNPFYFILAILAFCVFSFLINKLNQKKHQILLIITSTFFIAYFDWVSLCLLLVYSNIAYYAISYYKNKPYILNRLGFSGISILMGYKVIQAFLVEFDSSTVLVMLGISYYSFRITATLFDTARNSKNQMDYLSYLNFCLFFPLFIGGPIQRQQTFLRNQTSPYENIQKGMIRILIGIIKKLLICEIIFTFFISWLHAQIFNLPTFNIDDLQWGVNTLNILSPQLSVFLFGLANILRAYFDLSALTDIAIGMGNCFGYTIDENFNKPLLSLNIIDFWRRWHMTIAGWAKNYIFSPLMLKFRNIGVAVMGTMLFMGFWHHPGIPWIFWGIGHGVGLIVCGIWQHTKLAKILKQTKQWLLIQSTQLKFEFSLPTFRLSMNSSHNNPMAGAISVRILTVNLSHIAKALILFLYFLPAWILTFSYMSLIFIAVSANSLSQAIEMYSILFGFVGT